MIGKWFLGGSCYIYEELKFGEGELRRIETIEHGGEVISDRVTDYDKV